MTVMTGSLSPAATGGGIRATAAEDRAATASDGAFTIVEAVISTIIVAVMLVAALSTVGASRLTEHKASLAHQGRLLAESLMAEVLRCDYEDPNGAAVFGREAGESATTRTDFDDVDDYDGWSSSPPRTKTGTQLSSTTDWTRTVTVVWIDPMDPSVVKAAETGAKRVTITASYNDVPQATLVALKTDGVGL